jgi:hypothetical protein
MTISDGFLAHEYILEGDDTVSAHELVTNAIKGTHLRIKIPTLLQRQSPGETEDEYSVVYKIINIVKADGVEQLNSALAEGWTVISSTLQDTIDDTNIFLILKKDQ